MMSAISNNNSPTAAPIASVPASAVISPPTTITPTPSTSTPGTWFVSQIPPNEPSRPLTLCSPTDEVQLHYLPDVPQFVPTVAQLLYDEWSDIFHNHLNIFDVKGVEESLIKDYFNKTRPNCILVATVGGEFAATGTVSSEDAPAFHPYAGVKPWLTYLVCSPQFRGRGIAALICHKSAELCRAWGYRHIWLICETEQLESMYSKYGWKSVERLFTWAPRVFTVMRRDFQQMLPKGEGTNNNATTVVPGTRSA